MDRSGKVTQLYVYLFIQCNNVSKQIYNRQIEVDGISIFYREAGKPQSPSLLLLHGFPTSSIMFKNLMIAL